MSLITDHGQIGGESYAKMATTFYYKNMRLSFDSAMNSYTILNSSKSDVAKIADLLKDIEFQCWKPEILDQRDDKGNIQLKLQPIQTGSKDRMPTAMGVLHPSKL